MERGSSSCRQDWQLLYDRLQKAIDNIRYYNKKSQDFARSELIKTDPMQGLWIRPAGFTIRITAEERICLVRKI